MIFNHENYIKKEGSFKISKEIQANANKVLDKPILKEFWFGHTFRNSIIRFTDVPEMIFSIGKAKKISVDNYAYAINIEPDGICISAKDEINLIYGFMTLLDCIKICNSNNELEIECCEIKENPCIKNRMIHFCVFPDTELWELKKFVRLCGVLKYSHLVLEFWGMLKYDCLKELSWNHAFTKEQIKPIIEEAENMGLEIIPMFNHWGHASASRSIHGKHVVLDQNPSLYHLFSEDGWCWNTERKEVRTLMKNIRRELLELCGKGGYFHIGCDEASNFIYNEENLNNVCNYINEINEDLTSMGRKTIMWGDMLLYKHKDYNKSNGYTASAPNEKCEKYMLSKLNKNIVIADWQYTSKEYPIETSLTLQKAGFNVLVCPWDRSAEYSTACINTVKKNELSGLLHTTWHTLSLGMPFVAGTAAACWGNNTENNILNYNDMAVKTAAIMRKIYFADGSYEKSGWAKYETGVIVV